MKQFLLNQIIKRCCNELENHPEYNHFPHWTFLIKNNRIISAGKNNSKIPHPRFGYHQHFKDLGFDPKTHSELDCILNSSRTNIQGSIAINVRLSRNKLPRMSMPCPTCYKLLDLIGIKRCYFTTDNKWGELTF